jgi:hypothetical protein
MAAERILLAGQTDVFLSVAMRDSTTGALKGSIAYGTPVVKWQRDGAATATTVTLSDGTLGSHADSTWKETQIAGVYQLCIADAAFAAGVKGVTVVITSAGAIDKIVSVALTAFDLNAAAPSVNAIQISGDATAADNCESFFDGTGYAGTNNVIPTVSSATLAADQAVNVTKWDGHAVLAHTIEGAPVVTVKVGTGAATGEMSIAAGIANVNVNTEADHDLTATQKTSVQAAANAALVANNLDHVAGTATGIPALPSGTYLDGVKVSVGTGAGQLSITSGVADVNVTQVSGSLLDTHASGALPADVKDWNGTAVHAATVNGIPVVQLHNSAGTGGINAPANFELLSIDGTSGAARANLWSIMGTLLTETAGYLAAAFSKFFNIAGASHNHTVASYNIASADAGATAIARTGADSDTLKTLSDQVDGVKTIADKLDGAMVVDGAVYQFTANALELAPTGGGGGASAADIAKAMFSSNTGLDYAGANANSVVAQIANNAGGASMSLDDIADRVGDVIYGGATMTNATGVMKLYDGTTTSTVATLTYADDGTTSTRTRT